MTETADETAEIAQLYAFCSSVLADAPDEAAVEGLTAEPLPESATPQALDTGLEGLEEWRETVDGPAEEAEELKRVHTRLFVGPRPRLQVHESWYADDYLGKPLAAVKRSYRDLGIFPSDQLREEADHVAVSLAALEILARDGDDESRRAFLEAHGWWLPELAADIREVADHPFYEAIGWVLEGVLEADAHGREIDLAELSPGYSLAPSVYVPDGPEK